MQPACGVGSISDSVFKKKKKDESIINLSRITALCSITFCPWDRQCVCIRLCSLFRLSQLATACDINTLLQQWLFFLGHCNCIKHKQIIQVYCTKLQTCLSYFKLAKRICKWFWQSSEAALFLVTCCSSRSLTSSTTRRCSLHSVLFSESFKYFLICVFLTSLEIYCLGLNSVL